MTTASDYWSNAPPLGGYSRSKRWRRHLQQVLIVFAVIVCKTDELMHTIRIAQHALAAVVQFQGSIYAIVEFKA